MADAQTPQHEAERALQRYLGHVRAIPSLTTRDESRLLAVARTGDGEAKRRVIDSYLAKVADAALAMDLTLLPLDAIQEANLILVRLVEDESVEQIGTKLIPAVEIGLSRFLRS